MNPENSLSLEMEKKLFSDGFGPLETSARDERSPLREAPLR
jgi:hypothetical protein